MITVQTIPGPGIVEGGEIHLYIQQPYYDGTVSWRFGHCGLEVPVVLHFPFHELPPLERLVRSCEKHEVDPPAEATNLNCFCLRYVDRGVLRVDLLYDAGGGVRGGVGLSVDLPRGVDRLVLRRKSCSPSE